jgi:hypothetical protein
LYWLLQPATTAGAGIRHRRGVRHGSLLPHDDGLRRVGAHEAGRPADANPCHGAENGADQRENGGAH